MRDPARAAAVRRRRRRVRRADYADPASLPAAFAGADQLLLVSSSDPRADAVRLHRTAIDAAVAAGVGRILYTSHQGAALDTPFGPGARPRRGPSSCSRRPGCAWTSLRNGFYAHSLGWLVGPWRETGVIAVPVDGPVSWTAREDEAEAAAVILASDGAYDGPDDPHRERGAHVRRGGGDRLGGGRADRPERGPRRRALGGRRRSPPGSRRAWPASRSACSRRAQQGFFAGTDPLLATAARPRAAHRPRRAGPAAARLG